MTTDQSLLERLLELQRKNIIGDDMYVGKWTNAEKTEYQFLKQQIEKEHQFFVKVGAQNDVQFYNKIIAAVENQRTVQDELNERYTRQLKLHEVKWGKSILEIEIRTEQDQQILKTFAEVEQEWAANELMGDVLEQIGTILKPENLIAAKRNEQTIKEIRKIYERYKGRILEKELLVELQRILEGNHA